MRKCKYKANMYKVDIKRVCTRLDIIANTQK